MKGHFVVRISPADVGSRVSVRSRLPADDPDAMTDTVGRLLSWDDTTVRIERRDGTLVSLAVGDLVAGRVIPEPPDVRRR